MSTDIGQVVHINRDVACPTCANPIEEDEASRKQKVWDTYSKIAEFCCFLMVGFLAAVGFLVVGTLLVFHGSLWDLFS